MRILLGADLVVRIGEMRMLLFRGSLSLNWDNGCLTGTTGVSPVDILNGQDARSPSMVVLQGLYTLKYYASIIKNNPL